MPGSPPPVEGGVSVPSPPDGYRNVPVSAPDPDLHVPGMPGDGLPGGVLVVDYELLERAVSEAEEAAEAADGLARSMANAVRRSGPAPWGDDPALGQTFGSVFADPRDALFQALQGLPQVLRNIAEDLRGMDTGFHGAQKYAESAIAQARTHTI
ncbi:hypothetical protein [Streptomyces sp. NPDC057694]|uniref:hypothetical protein n=1 Tax=Streptomyces sp. NPDC057694 TaxID=3346216 RepID=UPI0036B311BE